MKYNFKYTSLLLKGLCILLVGPSMVNAQTISTVAGDGSATIGTAGTGGTNTVAADVDGNIYVATGGLNTIRKITPANVVTTFAGTGSAGFSGDNGIATSATFNNIQDLFIANGFLYVADAGNRRIRKIDLSSGIVTTAAGDGTIAIIGTGIGAACGVAVDNAGNIYVAGGGSHVVLKISNTNIYSTIAGTGEAGFSGDGGMANMAQLNLPTDLSLNGDKLYIADCLNRRIRSVDLNSNSINTAAGDGTTAITGSGIGAANSVAVDGGGNIFVTTGAAGNAIRKISNTVYTTVSGGNTIGSFSGDNGLATDATLDLPTDLYISGTDLLVADLKNRRVRKIDNTTVPLPISLLSFAAAAKNGHIILTWKTAMEKNASGFEMERSMDARTFHKIGFLKSQQNNPEQQTNYTFEDREPAIGENFYRLKMIDNDGIYAYSYTVSAFIPGKSGISISPIPTKDMITFSVSDEHLLGTGACITDIQGKIIKNLTLASSQQLNISKWAAGIYYLKLEAGNNYKFIKD